jgi:hypothetical protein
MVFALEELATRGTGARWCRYWWAPAALAAATAEEGEEDAAPCAPDAGKEALETLGSKRQSNSAPVEFFGLPALGLKYFAGPPRAAAAAVVVAAEGVALQHSMGSLLVLGTGGGHGELCKESNAEG